MGYSAHREDAVWKAVVSVSTLTGKTMGKLKSMFSSPGTRIVAVSEVHVMALRLS